MVVKITQGAYGHRPNGHSRKTIVAGECVDLPDSEAKRIIALGVADPVEEQPPAEVATPPQGVAESEAGVNPPDSGNGADGEKTAHLLDDEQLMTMTVKELTALAGDLGVDTKKCKNKTELVAAIIAVDVTPGLGIEDPV